MTIGASIFLIAIGAILAFAVNVDSSAIDVNTIGVILMLAGGLGLVLGLFFWTTKRRQIDPETGAPMHTGHDATGRPA